MKKRLLTLLILILLAQVGITQENKFGLKVIKSEIFQDDKKTTILQDSKSDGKGGLVVLRSFHKLFGGKLLGHYIDHYDSQLKLIKSYTLEDDGNLIKGMMVSNNKIHIIKSFKNEKSYDFIVLTSELSEFNFKKNTLIQINETEFKDFFNYPLKSYYKAIKLNNLFNASSDWSNEENIAEISFSKKQHFFSIVVRPILGKTIKLRSYIFDNQFKPVSEHTFEKEIKKKFFKINDLHLDDTNGSLHFISKVTNKKSKKDINYHYELYKLDNEGESQLILDTQNQHIGSLKIIKDHGRLSCVGFYSDKKESRYKGVSLYAIDPSTLKSKGAYFQPFSEQFLADKYGDKNRKKELYNLEFRSAFMNENGDVIINAEEHKVVIISSANSTKTSIKHYFNDIVSCKISQEGRLLWARNINKAQRGINYSSFRSISRNGKIYHLINASEEIKKISDGRIQFGEYNKKTPNIYVISLDSEGVLDYDVLVPAESEIIYQVSNGTLNNDKSEIIILGSTKKDKRLVKISF